MFERGRRALRRKRLSASVSDADAGLRGGLGCSLFELPPGARGWPFHFHTANHEAVYVLAGRATLRLGAGTIELRAGDYVALPAGPAAPHALECTGAEPFRYLCFSTQLPTDITCYPDSQKVALFGGAAPGGDPDLRKVTGVFRADDAVDYWEGEDGD